MKNNRLDVILHRNQQGALVDLLLAIAFVVLAMTTGLAMKTALGDLAGVPVDSGSGAATTLVPCAQLASADPRGDGRGGEHVFSRDREVLLRHTGSVVRRARFGRC